MRFAALYQAGSEVRGAKERIQAHRVAGERVHSALLAVDDADRSPDLETRLPKGVDRPDRGAARRHDVLHEDDALALLVDALDAVLRPVGLRFLADDEEREAGGERRRRRERDGAELRPGEEVRPVAVRRGGRGDPLAERAQELRLGLEAVLVEVVRRALPGAEDEVALEVRALLEAGRELRVVHGRAAARTSWPSRTRRSPGSLPAGSEIIEPSSK